MTEHMAPGAPGTLTVAQGWQLIGEAFQRRSQGHEYDHQLTDCGMAAAIMRLAIRGQISEESYTEMTQTIILAVSAGALKTRFHTAAEVLADYKQRVAAVVERLREWLGSPSGEIRELLTWAWRCDYCLPPRPDLAVDLFRAAGFTTDSPALWADFSDTFDAWRGTSQASLPGLSWTTSPEIARFYAQRAARRDGGLPCVFRGRIRKWDLLACFDHGSYVEVVATSDAVSLYPEDGELGCATLFPCEPASRGLEVGREQTD